LPSTYTPLNGHAPPIVGIIAEKKNYLAVGLYSATFKSTTLFLDFDERCPPEPQFGICPVCPPTCPSGQICCSTGCGSNCMDILTSPGLLEPA